MEAVLGSTGNDVPYFLFPSIYSSTAGSLISYMRYHSFVPSRIRGGHAENDHIGLVFPIFLINFLDFRHFRPAGGTPGGPEVEEDGFTAMGSAPSPPPL
mgnify:CR=1 FL=1